MGFPYNMYLLAGMAAFAASLLSLPFWRRFCVRVGLVDDPGHRKIHHVPVPLAGGLAVLTGLFAPLMIGVLLLQFDLLPKMLSTQPLARHGTGPFAGFTLAELLDPVVQRRGLQVLVLFLGALGMGALGFLDDKYELPPSRKFAGQLLFGLLTAAAGIRITLFVHNIYFSYAVTILWILTVTNAMNFMDNMNGLCAGLGAVAAWLIGLQGMIHVHYLVATIGFLMLGALLGFLPYNFPRATAFLGDTGSHVIGYLLAILTILPHYYSALNPHPWAVLSPLLILAVPLGDLVWVVYLRWRMGKPFYIGDTNHLSHRLVRRGLTPTLSVMLILLAATVVGSVALFL